ncbi:MAG: DUF4302 domain-containing protein [Bacteroidaceae bacterium]|nr:DUF4302 domain-containing protein [Bacteroidaceae bacterium]
MMKDIRYITMSVALATIALAGCSRFEEADLFDESAALRIEHNAERLQEILVNAPEGWVMQYHTGKGVAVFEGFNLFARFEKGGKVTLAGDHRYLRDGNAGKYTEHASLYELIREDGLVLAFNTWNNVLTPFVDPVAYWAAPELLLKDGEGMQGDQNLVVMSMKEDEIICRGERYDALIRLVKADRDWQTYIADTKAMKDLITSDAIDSYYITTEDETMYCVGLRDGRYRISDRVKNPLRIDSLSCCFTPTGFRNERPDTIAGHVFQEFKMNEDGSALVNEDGSVRIIATWDSSLAESTAIMWMDAESLSDDLKALYDQLNAALTAENKNYSLIRLGIGKTTNANNVTGLVMEWKISRTKRGQGGMELSRSVPALGQMTIACAEDAILDNEMKKHNAEVIALVREFGAALAGTYQMTPNSNFVPTEVLFQALEGETTFSLTAGN